MGRSRRAYKKTRSKVRVGAPKAKTKLPRPAAVALPGTGDRLEWNDKSTLLDNYRSLGIVANPNVLGARSGYGKTLQLVSLQKPMSAEPPEEYNSDNEPDDLRSALGKKRKDGKSAPVKRLTKMQRVYVSRLITKHGDNYEAMWRDMKLNKMQEPVGVLRSLCDRFRAFETITTAVPSDNLEIKAHAEASAYCPESPLVY